MGPRLIVAADTAETTHRWRELFQQACPEARVVAWSGDAKAAFQADYAIVWRPPADLFPHQRSLKAVFNLGAGVDALLKSPGLPRDIPVFRLENAGMADQMAEYVVHGLADALRQFPVYQVAQAAGRWVRLPAMRRQDWPIGVMGLGEIGTQVLSAVAALGYPVAGWSRSPRMLPGVAMYSGRQELPAFLARSRVLVNVLPLTSATENILCRENLQRLLPDAYIVNVGRGEHLVEQDLLDLIDSGHVRGALLDVFRTEPLPVDHPFWSHPKIRITPHVSAMTLEHEAVGQILGRIAALQRGEQVSGVVCRLAGY